MAVSKVVVYLFTVLIPLAIINCQDTPSLPSTPGIPSIPGLPTFPGIPNIPGIPDFRGKRQVTSPDSDDDHTSDVDHAHQERLFFGNFGGFNFGNFFGSLPTTTCNFTTQPDRTCISCIQVLNCGSTNTGVVYSCHGFKPYCNSGSCSKFPGTACTTTTTTTTTPATGR